MIARILSVLALMGAGLALSTGTANALPSIPCALPSTVITPCFNLNGDDDEEEDIDEDANDQLEWDMMSPEEQLLMEIESDADVEALRRALGLDDEK